MLGWWIRVVVLFAPFMVAVSLYWVCFEFLRVCTDFLVVDFFLHCPAATKCQFYFLAGRAGCGLMRNGLMRVSGLKKSARPAFFTSGPARTTRPALPSLIILLKTM